MAGGRFKISKNLKNDTFKKTKKTLDSYCDHCLFGINFHFSGTIFVFAFPIIAIINK